MVSRRVTRTENSSKPPQPRKRATTPEGRENQVIALAIDRIEERIMNGTASAQELVHFAKLGSTRERLEQDRLENDNALLKAKVEQMAQANDIKELYQNAIDAMRSYSGQDPLPRHDDD